MIKSIQILLVIIFSNFCFGQNESENIKSEAEKVFYDIVNVYKSEDCEMLTSYLNDSILIINSPKDTVLKTSAIINFDKYCGRVFSRVNKNINDAIHKKYYKLRLVTGDEFSKFKDKSNFSNGGENLMTSDVNFSLYFLAHKSHRFNRNDVFVCGIEPLKREDFYVKDSNGNWQKKEGNEFDLQFFKLYLFVLRKTDTSWKIVAIAN